MNDIQELFKMLASASKVLNEMFSEETKDKDVKEDETTITLELTKEEANQVTMLVECGMFATVSSKELEIKSIETAKKDIEKYIDEISKELQILINIHKKLKNF